MAFYKPAAGLDVKYLCSWDYRVGRICDMVFLRRPRAWRISCSRSQRILLRASPQNKRVKYLTLEGLHAREILGVIKTKSFPQSLRKATSMRTSSPLAVGWELQSPVFQQSLHLRVTELETLQQHLGKNKSPSQVLAAGYEINCFSFMFCRT